MTDTDNYLAAQEQRRPSTNKQARSVYYNSMKKKDYSMPDESSEYQLKLHHHNTFSTTAKTKVKKKKINKLLCEIVG